MTSISILQRAVEKRHDCFAILRMIVNVCARRADGSDLDTTVVVFSLAGHPSAEIAYAWCDPGPGPDRVRLQAVLHGGRIDSPVSAVRWALGTDQVAAEQVS